MKRFILISYFLVFVSLVTVYCAPIKVACIGNSITYGAGIANHFQNSYPGILQTMLGGEYDVRNFGVSGTTTLKKGDFPYVTTNEYRWAQEFQPDIVTIKLGTNDSKAHNWKYGKDFEKDISSIIETFKNLNSHPKVYLCLPVPCRKYSDIQINDSTIQASIIPTLKRVAKKLDVEIIDLYTPLKAYPNFFPDTVHPNAEGSAKIAAVIYSKLTGKEALEIDVNNPFPGKKTIRKGQQEQYNFTFMGRSAIVVKPKKPAPGNPWIWRPAFFDAFAKIDTDLLEKGFYVVYYDLTHLYGSPNSVQLGNQFYNLMTNTYKLSDKVTLEGFSRGGYFVFNWAYKNPDKVACIYVDAPVCNIKSWPGKEKRPDLWQDFLKEWNIKDAEDNFIGDALQLLEPLAKANIPIISVCGGKDSVVPFQENFKPVMEKYQKMGGIVELILKPDCDHHPHSIENPQPVVDFILRYQKGYEKDQLIHSRGTLHNAFSRFLNEKKGCVAFLGGSITEMNGWRNMIEEDLKQRFPECNFTFIDAGISSLGSTPHAFRFQKDVLDNGTPDLLFVEAAVNDDTNGFGSEEQIKGMEGIVRHALLANPYMDIVMLHFIYDPFIPLYDKGIYPDVVMNHERVANWYGVSSIDLGFEIASRMKKSEFTWEDFGGTHPKPFGHRYYSATINHLFDYSIRGMANWTRKEHEIPAEPLDKNSYYSSSLIDPSNSHNLKGFSMVQSWQSYIPNAGTRIQYVNVPMLTSTKAGASLEFKFNGRAVGIYGTFGPDAATLEYSIDKGPYKRLDTYTKWSGSLFIPWLYVFDDNLSSGEHLLKVRVSNTPKTGVIIYKFAVN